MFLIVVAVIISIIFSLPCPLGTWSSDGEDTSGCEDCPFWKTTSSTGTNSIDLCLCNYDEFGESGNTTVCELCPEYEARENLVLFTTDIDDCLCIPGFAGSIACAPCGIDQFAEGYGNSACSNCGPNAHTASVNSTLASDCRCSPGFGGTPWEVAGCSECASGSYSAEQGDYSSLCVQCPSRMTSHAGSSSESDCRCAINYYGASCVDTMCNNVWSNSSTVCNGHGTCETFDTCTCTEQWTGDFCTVDPSFFPTDLVIVFVSIVVAGGGIFVVLLIVIIVLAVVARVIKGRDDDDEIELEVDTEVDVEQYKKMKDEAETKQYEKIHGDKRKKKKKKTEEKPKKEEKKPKREEQKPKKEEKKPKKEEKKLKKEEKKAKKVEKKKEEKKIAKKDEKKK